MNDKEEERSRAKMIGTFMTVPFVLAIPPVVGWYLGTWLDKYFGWTPYLAYSFLFFGILAGGKEFYRIIKKYGQNGNEL